MSAVLEEIQETHENGNQLSRRQLSVAMQWRELINNNGSAFYKEFYFDVEGNELDKAINEHDELITDPELEIVFKWTGEENAQQEQQILREENGFVLTAIAYATKSGELASIWYFGENSNASSFQIAVA